MKEPKPQAQSQTYVMENPLRSPKVFKGIMCQSPNKIPWKQVFIFMDLGLFMDSGLSQACTLFHCSETFCVH